MNFSRGALFHMKTRIFLKYFVRACRLRLGLGHYRKHKFNHNFQDTINPLCSYSLESESTTHFFLRYQNFTDLRKCLMNELIKIDSRILTLDEKTFHGIGSISR